MEPVRHLIRLHRSSRSRLAVTAALTGLLIALSAPAAPADDADPPQPSTSPSTSPSPSPTPSTASTPTTPAVPAIPALPARGDAYMGMGVLTHDGSLPDTDTAPSDTVSRATQTEGVDVSSYQGNVDWKALWGDGVKWAYTKATEGTYYTNPYFTQQYDGSYDAGLIRGSYHFATPDTTGGAKQADYFVDHGGGWSKDGKTLPGVLDIEWNPYGDACYGKSKSGMVTWVRDFLNRYKARTGRAAVVYTATSWWTQCTGNSGAFGATNPLWIARYASTPGTLPSGWSAYTMWQYTSTGKRVGDHDRFNGTTTQLKDFATG
ncbi:lysozyme [Streptomyces sp. LP11]|uniref:Lysozyme n=1 Tax=Streptomyces pyxinicus TaxID=2970331 RepID=A0ABT2B8L3_9ACTN|nr:lysozyme [Streptomyces sp. LP11]MCS0604855.1 lysozyme [Streptomyces sp. LP11]